MSDINPHKISGLVWYEADGLKPTVGEIGRDPEGRPTLWMLGSECEAALSTDGVWRPGWRPDSGEGYSIRILGKVEPFKGSKS